MIRETTTTFHKHNTQALEQSQPAATINHSSFFWWKTTSTQTAPNPSRCKMRQQQTCCFAVFFLWTTSCPWDEFKTPQDSRQVTGQVCHSGTVASGWGGGWNVFWLQQVDTSGRNTGDILPQPSSLLPKQLTESLPPYRLLFSGHKQSKSLFSPPDPYTQLLPGGCCSRNEVQAFDPAPDHWLKGCHFGFRPLSIPRQLFISKPGRHTFLSHLHILHHVTNPFCPLPSYCTRELAFCASTNTSMAVIVLELNRCYPVLFSPCQP